MMREKSCPRILVFILLCLSSRVVVERRDHSSNVSDAVFWEDEYWAGKVGGAPRSLPGLVGAEVGV